MMLMLYAAHQSLLLSGVVGAVFTAVPFLYVSRLLDRAAAEGDERALLVLETQGVACFDRSNKAVNEATVALRTRLGLIK